jgi:DNA-binding transcriptional LysR family regulator
VLLHQLNIFSKVVEEKSFSKAAESIYLSQSTVSTHINNLEKFLGRKLFDRLGKEVVLTYFGERLYSYAKEMLALQEMMLFSLKEMTIEGHIRIAASTVPAQYIVPKLISRFSKKYPGIKITLNSLDSKNVAESLVKGKSDCGFLGNQYFPDELQFIPIKEEKLIFVTPPEYHFSNNVSIKDITTLPFLFRKSSSGTQVFIEKTLLKANVDITGLNIIGHFESVQIIKQCVKEGMGVSIISEVAASDYVQQNFIRAYELKEFTEKRTFYLAYNKARTLSPAVNEFISRSMDELAALH